MIKILVTGDFCPNYRIEQLVLNNKLREIYNDFYPYVEDIDLNILNLECPLANSKSPIQKFGPNLIAIEECIKAIIFGKFNIVTLSNNHIMDHGENGLSSTINLCRSNNIDFIGAGKNLEEASRPLIKVIRNKRICFLNFSEKEFSTAGINSAGSNPLDLVENYYSIKSALKKSDYLIVIVHGGHEGYSFPSPKMVETYRFFVDAGADIVVGHHTHCYSGYERYNKGFIFYSLGNFIFDKVSHTISDWNYGYALKLILSEDNINVELIPYRQCGEIPGLVLLKESEIINFHERIKYLNNIINNSYALNMEWEKFVQENREGFLINFECGDSKIYRFLRFKKLIPGLISNRKKMRLLNLIRCESLRELSLECLKPK